jgi:Flp pilus assembly protein TadB
MNPNPTEPISGRELSAIRRELSQIKGVLIALLVIVAMGTFLADWILGLISLLVLILAIGYVILLPIDGLLKRRMARFDEEIERKVLESVRADSSRPHEH